MERLILLALLMLMSVPAMAEDVSTRTLCQMLPQYQPEQGVEYTPGADVNGQMVVPADVNKVLKNQFDAVEIPIEYNVLSNMGVNLPAGSQVQPTVAILKVYGNGRVKYNGEDVTPQAQALCTLRQPNAPGQRSRATIVQPSQTHVLRNPQDIPDINMDTVIPMA